MSSEAGHLEGCAAQSVPGPGICFCDERRTDEAKQTEDGNPEVYFWHGFAEGEQR